MKRFGYAAGVLGLAAAIVGGYLWMRSPEQPSPYRVPLARVQQQSQLYLARHAQSPLACPAGSTNCVVCNMQDAAGNLACQDHAGGAVSLTANGTPVYQLHTPIPKSDGFTHDAVGFNGVDAYFAAGVAGVGDQTTNDFAVSGWVCPRALAVADVIVSKREAGGVGFSVNVDGADATTLAISIQDASGATDGAVTPVAALTNGVCSYFTVNFDRDGNASAFVNGAGGATTVDISGRSLTIASTAVLTIGRAASAATNFWDGRMAGVIIHNGLVTLAEHQAMYRAFHVPVAGDVGVVGAPSYTQTTTWKWPLPPEVGFGARLGTYGPGQWPVAYASTLVDTSENPPGLGFPGHASATNVIGYPNELDSWTATGAVVVANAAESPDGAMTSEQITFSADDQNVLKNVVGGGAIAAGSRWCFRLAYKRISGTCVGVNIRASSGATPNTALTDATTWTWATVCDTTATATKRGVIYATAHGSCVVDVADVSFHQRNLPIGSCTNCTGNVNCVCNASYPTGTWDDRASYMPAVIERGELEMTAAVAPEVHEAGIRRHLAHLGDWAYLAEGLHPAFVKRNHGGMPSTVGKGKPLQLVEEKRKYTGSWDYRNGLTNTNPRKTAALSLSINGGPETYQHSTSEGRYVTAEIDASSPAHQTDLNARSWSVGCNLLGQNCADAVIQDFTFWSRPAQVVRVTDPTLVTAADFTGSAWLSHASVPRLACPTGVSSSNCWVWDMGEYSGSLYDRINGVALTAVGTPTYQVNSGLISRGQGRRGWNFRTASTEYAQSPNTTSGDVTTGSLTLSAVVYSTDAGELARIVAKRSATDGYEMFHAAPGDLYCTIADGGVSVTATATMSYGAVHVAECVLDRGANTLTAFVDGVAGAPQVAGAVASLTNAEPLVVGTYSPGPAGRCWNGEVYEVEIHNVARSPAQILARYKQTTQRGTYWADDANTVAHYKFNERLATNGVGLRDHSGNGNHLTVLNGTPDAQYRDMPWPAGSGVVRPAVLDVAGVTHAGGVAAAVPSNQQSFSVCTLYRWHGGSNDRILSKGDGVAGDSWSIEQRGDGPFQWKFFTDSDLSCNMAASTSLFDRRWHLLCAKVVWGGGQYTASTSTDGVPFAGATTCTGDPSQNVSNVQVNDAALSQENAGALILKDYALTDTDVAAMWTWPTGPFDDLTYARASTSARGVCYDTAVDPVAGVRTTCFGDNQVPFAYDSLSCNFPGNLRMCLGEPVHSAVTNVALQSEDAATTWTNNNTAEVVDSAVAPDGNLTADTVTATAASGDLRQVFAAIAAVDHTYCQYLKRNGTADVAGFLRLVTESTGIAIASTAFSATSAWQKFCVSGTATLNDTRIVTEITTDTESVFWWGAQLTATATAPGPYCPTNGSTQTCNAPTSNYVAAAEISSWTRSEGVVVSSGTPYATGRHEWWSLYNGADNNGRIYSNNTPGPAGCSIVIHDATGVVQQSLATTCVPDAMTGTTAIWDSQLAWYGTRRAADVSYATSYAGPWDTYTTDMGANWTPAAGTNLHLGNHVGSFPLEGNLQEVYVWSER